MDPESNIRAVDGNAECVEQYAVTVTISDTVAAPVPRSNTESHADSTGTSTATSFREEKEMNLAIVTALLFALSTPATVLMKVNQRQQLQVTGRASGELNWVSSDDHVATVINSSSPKLNGMVVTHRPGTVTITATAGTDKAETKLTVVP